MKAAEAEERREMKAREEAEGEEHDDMFDEDGPSVKSEKGGSLAGDNEDMDMEGAT